jgi:hypothetical protein
LGLEVFLRGKPPLKNVLLRTLEIQNFHAPLSRRQANPCSGLSIEAFSGSGRSILPVERPNP